MCLQIRVFHNRKNSSENYPQIGHEPSKLFSTSLLGRKSWKYRFELDAQLLDWPERWPLRGAHMSRSVPEYIYVTVVTATGLQQISLGQSGSNIIRSNFGPTGARIRECFGETEANCENISLYIVSARIRIGHLPNTSTTFTALTTFSGTRQCNERFKEELKFKYVSVFRYYTMKM
jgi:hypothetical protein